MSRGRSSVFEKRDELLKLKNLFALWIRSFTRWIIDEWVLGKEIAQLEGEGSVYARHCFH